MERRNLKFQRMKLEGSGYLKLVFHADEFSFSRILPYFLLHNELV